MAAVGAGDAEDLEIMVRRVAACVVPNNRNIALFVNAQPRQRLSAQHLVVELHQIQEAGAVVIVQDRMVTLSLVHGYVAYVRRVGPDREDLLPGLAIVMGNGK